MTTRNHCAESDEIAGVLRNIGGSLDVPRNKDKINPQQSRVCAHQAMDFVVSTEVAADCEVPQIEVVNQIAYPLVKWGWVDEGMFIWRY